MFTVCYGTHAPTFPVDLSSATAKTLVRLRRDDLVRLCESRDLEPTGTKPQLAEALLQWRDNQQANDFSSSSPSSVCTARPPSTIKRRPNRNRSRKSSQKTATPPVLLRSERIHTDEPRTPPLSNAGVQNDKPVGEPELELDLGTLGLEDREIPPEKLQKLEKIGSGGFKDVFIGKFKGRKIAIAEFRGQLSAMDIKELKLLGGFDHPNIVRFLGVSIPENTRDTPVMIISELCTNGDLFDYIRNVNPPSLHKVLSIMLDIARGLEYLHLRKPSIIHRDCKSSNILITSKGTAKIADFGLAKVKQSTRSMVRSLVGTVNWQAPELWHAHPKYNHKVDVFSCACVYWEMLQWHLPNKKFPWEGMNEHAIYEIVGTKKQRPSLSGLRKQWCPDIVDLIERMWAQEHQDRPTMSEVVEALDELVKTY
ncbi:kinase-like domain-containing protein [Rhodocollybia butyracea]|uniref:Kinase-like domain-containing protein n=1 Tax=Rhodocollybia butyracea TaxID=206335 RepID=A0A9P5QA57_9AGAR|nr:kinase-like domain-containing protein [Rhodocollybia butyracea]